ncbi:hypothetical protein SAV31267_095310 [Streptomyces avermitilis]|uniref:Uncharacterized protein n=1 Tax=Streptomyces avermitilis TaxID=33903 RepID=A0A4D4N880_STRAX|nr:hypothetical protein SAVMC3_04750 [Streptomyces avermitilis]GDY80046.1 hypothetical protein SAV31267_095310 [Streptomyces avermitilis]
MRADRHRRLGPLGALRGARGLLLRGGSQLCRGRSGSPATPCHGLLGRVHELVPQKPVGGALSRAGGHRDVRAEGEPGHTCGTCGRTHRRAGVQPDVAQGQIGGAFDQRTRGSWNLLAAARQGPLSNRFGQCPVARRRERLCAHPPSPQPVLRWSAKWFRRAQHRGFVSYGRHPGVNARAGTAT